VSLSETEEAIFSYAALPNPLTETSEPFTTIVPLELLLLEFCVVIVILTFLLESILSSFPLTLTPSNIFT
jgi:hypothetical protein